MIDDTKNKILAAVIYLLSSIFYLLLPVASCQSVTADSLLSLLKNDKEDTNKVIHLCQLTRKYRLTGNFEKGLNYGKDALALARKINFKMGIADASNNLGNIYFAQADYPKALDYFLKALKIDEERNNKKGIATRLGNIGLVYWSETDYPKALDYYLKALKTDETLDNKNGIARHLCNIGIIHYEQKDYPKALEYYFKALKINETLGDKNNIEVVLGNIGLVYQEQASAASPDSAAYRERLFTKALDYYFRALKIQEELGTKSGMANTLGNIGHLYTEQKKYKEAEKYLVDALKIDKAIGSMNDERQNEEALAQLYSKTNRHQLALEHYKKAMALKDTIFSQENKKQLIRKEMNFEFEKKESAAKAEQEKKDAVTAEEKRKQKIITWSVASGLLLVVVFAGFIFQSLRVTRKQKLVIDVKNKHITDSINYAKRIQESLLLSEEGVSKFFPYETFILYQPKDIVSGDFYWLSSVMNSGSMKYVIAAADCTGHGVPGAFLSMIGNMLLNEVVNEKQIVNPSEILKELHHGIYHTLHRENESAYSQDGMDISLCTIDIENKIIRYAGASNPLYIIRNENGNETAKHPFHLETIKADSISLGDKAHRVDTISEVSFSTHEIPMQKGMRIYLFSDGYMDQFSKKLKQRIGSAQFKKLLLESAHLPMREQKEYLMKAFNDWMGGDKQIDDVLVIGIRI